MYKIAKIFLRITFDLCFGTKRIHMVKRPSLGRRVVFVAPNISWLDPLLMMAYIPGRPVFAMSAGTYRGLVKFFLRWTDVFIIDTSNPLSVKGLVDAIKKGQRAVIFAEGKLNESGMVAKIYDAPGLIAASSGAAIVPVHINGIQYSYASYMEKVTKRPFPKVTITFLDPRRVPKPKGSSTQESRQEMGDYLYRQMQDIFYNTQIDREISIFSLIMRAAKLYGKKGFRRQMIAEDHDRKPQSYKSLLIKSFALAGQLNKITKQGEHVGIMLPNSIANLCTFLGLTAYERVPAMLNFSSGERNIINCCKMATVKTVLTSRKFISVVGLERIVESLEKAKVKVLYLEDIAKNISTAEKIAALAKYKMKRVPYRKGGKDKKAVILFTSGSEGLSKAVTLSHYNIVSNISQVICSIGIGSGDVFLNALPMFHSFGLTIGTLLPLAIGVRLFLYPNPLHYRIIPELCYNIGATILAGTNTFLKNYAKAAHTHDFSSMRLVVSGAEALRDDTRNLWMDKFGIRIIQGYGTTETSPLITGNFPHYYRNGAIGKILPGMEYKIKRVDGVENGGELVVRGDNVMMGYMKIENPGKIIPLKDGWYETGDVVEIDKDECFFIKDRIKRFAKIAGEMVSLSSVENLAREAYGNDDELDVASVNVPHETRGEQVVLVSTKADISLSRIAEYAKLHGIAELCVPKVFLYIEEIPMLKTGKRDYISIREFAMKELKLTA